MYYLDNLEPCSINFSTTVIHVSKAVLLFWFTIGIIVCRLYFINRIYHRYPMQIVQSLPEIKRMMPETRFTEFLAFFVYPRVGISRSASETDD